jgi:hypothetical protein
MSARRIVFGVGATKAGTSWLYRYLHDHADCQMKAVKELHYFDTFDAETRDKQLQEFLRARDRFAKMRLEAEAEDKGWKVRNMERRITDMDALIRVIGGVRDGDEKYLAYLEKGVEEGQLTGDITPSYSLLDENMLRRMHKAAPSAKFLFLVRDPLDRLWSHIRMQAKRYLQEGQTVEKKSNAILWRVLNKGQETHLLERGDYLGTVARLRRAVPQEQLMVEYAENLFTEVGQRRVCEFLEITYTAAKTEERVHAGLPVVIRESLAVQAVELLKDHYEWANRTVGPLPEEWQNNLTRASA